MYRNKSKSLGGEMFGLCTHLQQRMERRVMVAQHREHRLAARRQPCTSRPPPPAPRPHAVIQSAASSHTQRVAATHTCHTSQRACTCQQNCQSSSLMSSQAEHGADRNPKPLTRAHSQRGANACVVVRYGSRACVSQYLSSQFAQGHAYARTGQQHQQQPARRVHLHHGAPRVLHQQVLGPVRRVVQRHQLRLRGSRQRRRSRRPRQCSVWRGYRGCVSARRQRAEHSPLRKGMDLMR